MGTHRRLPVLGGRPSTIGGEGENLQIYIEEINCDRIRERIGTEKLIRQVGNIDITSGHAFKVARKRITGFRYLYRDDGVIVGGLNGTKIGRSIVGSNIYVRSDMRRRGIASRLVEQVIRDYPSFVADSCMTVAGAMFAGYGELVGCLDRTETRKAA